MPVISRDPLQSVESENARDYIAECLASSGPRDARTSEGDTSTSAITRVGACTVMTERPAEEDRLVDLER